MVDDLADLGTDVIPQCHLYEDESQHVEIISNSNEEPNVTPQWGHC